MEVWTQLLLKLPGLQMERSSGTGCSSSARGRWAGLPGRPDPPFISLAFTKPHLQAHCLLAKPSPCRARSCSRCQLITTQQLRESMFLWGHLKETQSVHSCESLKFIPGPSESKRELSPRGSTAWGFQGRRRALTQMCKCQGGFPEK